LAALFDAGAKELERKLDRWAFFRHVILGVCIEGLVAEIETRGRAEDPDVALESRKTELAGGARERKIGLRGSRFGSLAVFTAKAVDFRREGIGRPGSGGRLIQHGIDQSIGNVEATEVVFGDQLPGTHAEDMAAEQEFQNPQLGLKLIESACKCRRTNGDGAAHESTLVVTM
jgi:hypothetical protein